MEKGFKNAVCDLLVINIRSYSNYAKQERPIINFLEKYVTKAEIEEFIASGRIKKFDHFGDSNQTNTFTTFAKTLNHFDLGSLAAFHIFIKNNNNQYNNKSDLEVAIKRQATIKKASWDGKLVSYYDQIRLVDCINLFFDDSDVVFLTEKTNRDELLIKLDLLIDIKRKL